MIRVLLVDDHKMFRDGIRPLLNGHRGVEVVGEAADGRSAVRLVEELRPDMVIMDISMPAMNGIDATRDLLSRYPGIRVIILSMHSDRRYIIEALKAGAMGYVLKDSAFANLLAAVDVVSSGRIHLDSRLADSALREYVRLADAEEGTAFTLLSPREREVLQRLTEGWSTKEIASGLHVSVKTVETHRKQIMDKLDLRSIAELTKYAIREGLTSLE